MVNFIQEGKGHANMRVNIVIMIKQSRCIISNGDYADYNYITEYYEYYADYMYIDEYYEDYADYMYIDQYVGCCPNDKVVVQRDNTSLCQQLYVLGVSGNVTAETTKALMRNAINVEVVFSQSPFLFSVDVMFDYMQEVCEHLHNLSVKYEYGYCSELFCYNIFIYTNISARNGGDRLISTA